MRFLTTTLAVAWCVCASLVHAAPRSTSSNAKTSQASAAKSSAGKHCLWRITNAKWSFYLLGSIHRLRAQDFPLPAAVDQAVAQSQQFYFEYDFNRDDEFARKLVAAAKLPHGVQIKDKVHAKTWDYLRTTARGGGTEWMNLKAWAIAMFVMDYPAQERLSASGVDDYVWKKARARNCRTRGLESIDEHVAVFGGMSDVESEAYLLQAIVYASQHDHDTREMISAWKAGNTERLSAIQTPVVREAPGLHPRFLQWRNERWIPVIESAINSGKPTMIVAGAAHFSGPNSVIAMLRARGYQIEQL
jgi:uncharacterized protein